MFLFDFSFFEWWAGLSPWIRLGVALLGVALSAVLWFFGYFFPWGIAAGITGIILVLFSFPTRAEKKGYHDF